MDVDILWENACEEEVALVNAWILKANELVSSYKSGKISRQKYAYWKKKYLIELDELEKRYSKEIQDKHDFTGWKDSWEEYQKFKAMEGLRYD